jgi:ribosome-associated protein
MKLSTSPKKVESSPEVFSQQVVEWVKELKALDVICIDVRGKASYTDFIIVASGTSDRHVQSIAEFVATSVKQSGHHLMGTEGLRSGQWALIDCGEVVVHVFHQFTRSMYNLEEIWKQAPHLRAV